jgi:hypothetical protein
LKRLSSYSESNHPRDEGVVDDLKRAKMPQAAAPLPGRRDELRSLAKDYGLSYIFGDEVAAIIKDMTEAAQDPDT